MKIFYESGPWDLSIEKIKSQDIFNTTLFHGRSNGTSP